ncbi:MAG: MaoC family dehydratase [Gammaproteobacteria bacterium]
MNRSLEPVRLRVDMPAILAYAEITGDFNPLHVDPVFAATTPMGGVIAHGTMSLNLLWQAIARTFGAELAANSAIDVRFARPVRVGDLVEAGGTESATRPGEFEVWVRNQDGVAVIEGTATLPTARSSGADR